MKEEKRTIYRCEYCNAYRLRKQDIEYHEQYVCTKKPQSQHQCWICKYFEDHGLETGECGGEGIYRLIIEELKS